MCGIAGFKENSGIGNPDKLISRMLWHLERRGPDDHGYMELNCPEGKWHFGHRRLAIIDLKSGHQPMTDEEQSVAVICNGEIYNFHSIRSRLAQLGHKFRTSSDTEVLIYGYKEWGIEKLLACLEGMFAFALLDLANDEIYLARDPYGQKPLFYSFTEKHGLAFASSLKSLLEIPWISREIDYEALAIGVALKYIPAPYTAYRMIRKLNPGSYICLKEKTISEKKFWRDSLENSTETLEKDTWTTLVHEKLLKCVNDCLISDVPVTLMLSSGLDSSLIAAMLAECGRTRDVPAVTVAFKERSYDEYEEAARLAKKYNLKHIKVLVEEDTVENAVTTALNLPDEPFADPSLIPTLVLSKAVRQISKVALGGDGGDELFGGYPTFSAIAFYCFLTKFPLKGLLNTLVTLLPVSHERYALRYKLRRFNRGLGLPPEKAFVAWLMTSDSEEISQILAGDESVRAEKVFSLAADISEIELTKLMSRIYLRLFLTGVLNKVDMASMYYGLEVRAPFLQQEMVHLALSLPAGARVSRFKTKFVLRKLANELGLDKHSRIPKRGFNIPLSQWIRGKLRSLVEPYLSREALEDGGFFKPEPVIRLWKEHLAGKENHFDILWSIINNQKFLLNV